MLPHCLWSDREHVCKQPRTLRRPVQRPFFQYERGWQLPPFGWWGICPVLIQSCAGQT
jgi:hypothetical protein